MKKNIKIFITIILSLILVLSFSFSAFSETYYKVDAFTYRIVDYGVSIHAWDHSSDVLVIPELISEKRVVAIDDIAFYNDGEVTAVDFSNAVYFSKIGRMAFCNSGLSGELNLTSTITDIGVGAFQGCEDLTSVTYNSNTVSIPNQCFRNCISLSSVEISNLIESIGAYAFQNCYSIEELYIPNNVTYIDSTAFDGDANLTIKCYTHSYAHQYAEDNEIPYVLLDFDDYYFLQGDVNGDGEVSISDVTYLQRIVALMVEPDDKTAQRADADLDEDISVQDATLLQRYASYYETGTGVGVEYIEYTQI